MEGLSKILVAEHEAYKGFLPGSLPFFGFNFVGLKKFCNIVFI